MKRKRNKKHADVLKRPPAICLKCGPADKMDITPKACEKCGYRAAADPELAKTVAADIANTERAAALTWEVAGRNLDDIQEQCPFETFGKSPSPGWICKGLPCEIEVERRGEDIHPHWRCWAAWLGNEMVQGGYSAMMLEARRITMEKKKQEAQDNDNGKENTE